MSVCQVHADVFMYTNNTTLGCSFWVLARMIGARMITWTTRQKPGPAALRARTCVFLCTNMCICTKSLSARLHVWCTQKSHVHKNKRRIPVCGIMFCLNARALCKRVYWLVHRNSHDSIAGFQSECAQGFFVFLIWIKTCNEENWTKNRFMILCENETRCLAWAERDRNIH